MRILYVVLMFLVSSAWATMQISDKVFFAGDEYQMGCDLYSHRENYHAMRSTEYPLEDYFDARGLSFWEVFMEWSGSTSTACRRGHVATWDIQDGVLRLINLEPEPFSRRSIESLRAAFGLTGDKQLPQDIVLPGSRINEPIPIERLDPTWRYPVVAEWYSGDFYLTKENHLLKWGYRPWEDIAFYHLVFSKGRLIGMKELNTLPIDVIRHSRTIDNRLDYWPSAVRKINYCKLLDRDARYEFLEKVLSLRRGAPIAAVNNLLGPPDSSDATDDGLRQRYYLGRIDPQREDPLDLALDLFFAADALDAIKVIMGDEDAFMRPVDRELLQASAAGDLAKVREKLAGGADVGARNNAGDSALTLAMSEDELPLFRLLVEHGAPVDVTEPQTPLDFALSQHDFGLARYLIEQRGVDVNAVDAYGFSALHHAARRRDVKMVRFLLERGGRVMADGRPLPKLLEEAVGNLEIFKLLVAAGAIDKDENRHQYLPLVAACDLYGADQETVRYLLALGADARNSDALVTACRRAPELIPILLEHGADPNRRSDSSGIPAWMQLDFDADECEQALATLRLFEQHGADFTLRDQWGRCGLHYAADWNCPAVIAFLKAKGLNINAKDHEGVTPLHLAADDLFGQKSIMALLAAGADAAICNDEGENALHVIFDNQWPSLPLVQALIAAGAKPHARRKNGDRPIDVLNIKLREDMAELEQSLLLWSQVSVNEKPREMLNETQASVNALRRLGDYLATLPPE